MAQALSVLAVNVNGLSASRKRRAFFLQLLQGNWDVIALMETHCPSSDIAEQWLREGAGRPWLGTAHWNHGTSRSRGVAVLMRSGYACAEVSMDYAYESGRVLRVSWQPAIGQRLAVVTVVAVYAPHVAAECPAFFAPEGVLQQALLSPPEGPVDAVFLAGDFNSVMRPEDVWGGAPPTGGQQGGRRN